jgi:xanthine dehydrogenase accessory factor
MAVTADEIAGSVGGGVMEVDLVDHAKRILEEKPAAPTAEIVSLVHRPDVPNASGMICSGQQTVIVCRLGPEDLPAVEAAAGKSGFRIGPDGLSVGGRSGSGGIRFRGADNGGFAYEENPGTRPRLFIIGGGHCALALSETMSRLGFRISLFDDRAELNTLEKNRFADEKTILESYEAIGDFVPAGESNYVVVMTIGYRFDEIVIRSLSEREFAYFGVLGSRAKMTALLRRLAAEGFDRERLSRLRTPVGLPIGSQTPEEIAVSIAAEIIAVKNGAALPRNQINLRLQ